MTKRVHPGEVLREEFMKPMHLTPRQLAAEINEPIDTIVYLMAEQLTLSPELAEKLAKRFETTPEFWVALQVAWTNDQ